MISLITKLKGFFQESLNSGYPQLSHCTVDVTPSTKITFGDYQCNSAMSLNGVRIFLSILFHKPLML